MSVDAPITVGRPTYRQLLANRPFTALLGVSLANVLATSLQILALSVLVYDRTGSALWSSTAFAAGFLPQLVGGTLLTSLADRYPPRPLLAGVAVLRATVLTVLAVADLPPGYAIALVATAAVVSPLPSAAQAALVARLVTGDLYVLGRSVFTLISSTGQLAGLAAGGTVVGLIGAHAALGLGAVIQLAGLLCVTAVPRTTRGPARATRWHPAETWRGNAGLLGDPLVRRILLSWWIPTTLLVGAESLMVAYVGESGQPSWTTGALLATFPAGAALGTLIIGRWCHPTTWARLGPWLLALVGAGLIPLVAHPPVAVAVLCLVVANVGTAYELGTQRLFIAAVPAERQGLALGLVSTGTMTGQGLGPVVAGAVAQLIGAGVTICALGVTIVLLTRKLGLVAGVQPAPGEGGDVS